jgi:hypothetical protein
MWKNGWVDIRDNVTPFTKEKLLATTLAPKVGADPALVLWWTYVETVRPGATFDSYHYSNCAGASSTNKYKIDHNCETPGSWQVGYGQQFKDIAASGVLEAAFKATYGNPNDPALVQRVGRNALSKSGIKKTFPAQTVAQLLKNTSTTTATSGNYWTYTLMRDPGISVYLVAQELAWDINGGKARGMNYRQVTWSWSSYYQDHWQTFSNVLWDVLNLWHFIDKGGPIPS